MLASYRLGSAIVLAAIVVSAPLTVAYLALKPPPPPAGQDLGEGYSLGSFRLTERSGRPVTEADLADDVWVAAFIFTRCPSSCPKISAAVRGLHAGKLRNSAVKFVSISVDPEHDTPAVLSTYAKALDADPDRWWFLTGPKGDVYDLILSKFHLPVAPNPMPDLDPRSGVEDVAHSDRLALVDVGNRVIGVFSSTEARAIDDLVARAKQRSGLSKPWVRRLPALNATLNGSCAILLYLGWTFIRSGRWRAHAACMISSVAVSAVFLASYLLYHYLVGSVAFKGDGALQFVYLTILFSHTLLATFGVVPLVTLTLIRAARRQFDRHARIARVTFPVWMYVSVTGVVIYLMLYELNLHATLPAV